MDLDATADPLHGNQEGRFFGGYYGHYCYLALYIFCGEFLLGARLRPSNIDAATGSLEELQRIVKQIRVFWPEVRILVRPVKPHPSLPASPLRLVFQPRGTHTFCLERRPLPAIETLEKLARAFELSMYQFFYEGKEPPKLPNLLTRKSPDENL